MGFFKSTFSLLAGIVCGIYISQNYKVPNIKQVAYTGVMMLENLEQNYSKSKKKDGD